MVSYLAERAILAGEETDIAYAVSALSVMTPGSIYWSGNLLEDFMSKMTSRGITLQMAKDLRMGMAMFGEEMRNDGPRSGRVIVKGHHHLGVKTGDWEVSTSLKKFHIRRSQRTVRAVRALESLPPEDLRQVMSRMIDRTSIFHVAPRRTDRIDLGDSVSVMAGALKTVLGEGDTVTLRMIMISPGEFRGDLVSVVLHRLTALDVPPAPRRQADLIRIEDFRKDPAP